MVQQQLFEDGSLQGFQGLRLFMSDPDIQAHGQELISGWRKAYPNVNIEQELVKAHNWQLEKKANQKKNQVRFLNNWLRKASPAQKSWVVAPSVLAKAMAEAMAGG